MLPSNIVFTSNAAKFNLYAAFVGPSSKNNYHRNTWTWNLKTDCLNFFLSQIGTFLFFFRFFDPKNKESRIFFNPEKIATNRKLCQKLKNSENREILIFFSLAASSGVSECACVRVCVHMSLSMCVCSVVWMRWRLERETVCVCVSVSKRANEKKRRGHKLQTIDLTNFSLQKQSSHSNKTLTLALESF